MMPSYVVRRCTCNDLSDDFDCDVCEYNQGISGGGSRVAGPCGQQNCWFDCSICCMFNTDECKK